MDDREAHEYYLDPEHRKPGPGRSRKHPKDMLTAILNVRVSPAMLNRVMAVAAAERRSAGSWVREALRMALMADERRRREAALAGEAEVLGGRAVPAGVFPARPEGLVEGSVRRGEARALGSTLDTFSGTGRTFSCPHLSVGNVVSAECSKCGPLRAAS